MAECTGRAGPPQACIPQAARATAEELSRQIGIVQRTSLLRETLAAVPIMVMILNYGRQIVAANQAALDILRTAEEHMIRKRPGEAVGCIHASDSPSGCGTGVHCVACGALQAILGSQLESGPVVRQCRILAETSGGIAPLDLKVTATPIALEGERFIVLALEDISQSKRLELLQRAFFHDVANTAGCIMGYAQMLTESGQAHQAISQRLLRLSEQLSEEIGAQHDLWAAESADLAVCIERIHCAELLEELREEFAGHHVAAGRRIQLGKVWDGTIRTDRRLLARVLRNMLKNSLEASPPGQSVSMDCLDQGEVIVLAVRNAQVIPERIQLQIFQRSFSTKGPGRGIGTYSMKLLGERYLKGKVEFRSQLPEGTTFTITLRKAGP